MLHQQAATPPAVGTRVVSAHGDFVEAVSVDTIVPHQAADANRLGKPATASGSSPTGRRPVGRTAVELMKHRTDLRPPGVVLLPEFIKALEMPALAGLERFICPDEVVDDGGIGESGGITHVLGLALGDFAEDSPHDLP